MQKGYEWAFLKRQTNDQQSYEKVGIGDANKLSINANQNHNEVFHHSPNGVEWRVGRTNMLVKLCMKYMKFCSLYINRKV